MNVRPGRLRRLRERARRRLGVRMRSALSAAVVVACASVFTGVAFVVSARLILTDNVDAAGTQRAAQIAAALDDTTGASLAAAVRPSPRERTVAQVVDPSDHVIAASAAIAGLGPISGLRPPPGEAEHEKRRLGVGHNDMFRVTALTVNTPRGQDTILVAESIQVIDEGTEAAIGALGVGLPVLALVAGFVTFLFVGRALEPVEEMRRQADTITVSSLHNRLPVPPAVDEISALANTMNTMLDRIESANTAQRRFVADASHELRSPLSTIHAGLDLLAASPLPEAAGAHVTRMHRESRRMARLIADLLLLARFDESGLTLRRQDVDLDDLVYTERDRLVTEHPELQVTVRVTPTRIDGDPHHLQRAVRNLLDNAARHAGAHVTVTLRRLPDTLGAAVELDVADDGPGIPPADRDRVFDRFVRLDDDRSRRGGGTGLGLAIARDVITAHGGTLTVQDAPDGGALLRIRLP